MFKSCTVIVTSSIYLCFHPSIAILKMDFTPNHPSIHHCQKAKKNKTKIFLPLIQSSTAVTLASHQQIHINSQNGHYINQSIHRCYHPTQPINPMLLPPHKLIFQIKIVFTLFYAYYVLSVPYLFSETIQIKNYDIKI